MDSGIPEVRLSLANFQREQGLLARYINEDGEWRDVVRPAHVVETVDDADWLARHSEALRGFIVCGYCGAEGRFRNRATAVRWFLGHSCGAEGEVLGLVA